MKRSRKLLLWLSLLLIPVVGVRALTISPPIGSITINGHTYTNSDWEANPQGTLIAVINDFVLVLTSPTPGLGHTPNLAGLKAISVGSVSAGSQMVRDGYASAGDGGRAFYTFSGSNCPAADDGRQVQPTAGTGCWIADRYDVAIFGPAGDGTTDDKAKLAAALAAVPTTGSVLYLERGKKYRFASDLTIPANVTVDCQMSWSLATSGDLDALGGLRRDSGAKLILSKGSYLQNCAMLQQGIDFPVQTPSGYGGTGVSWASGAVDAGLSKVLIVGANQCADLSVGTSDRFKLSDVECDGINGYKIGLITDSSVLSSVRAWPWGTVNYPTTPTNTRVGTGYLFVGASRADNVKLDIMDYGHTTGVDFENPGNSCCNVHVAEGWFDNNTNGVVNKANNVTFGKLSVYSSSGAGIVASGSGSTTSVTDLLVSGATDCVALSNSAKIAAKRADFSGCTGRVTYIADGSVGSRVEFGPRSTVDTATITTTPYIRLPADPNGMPSSSIDAKLTVLSSGLALPNILGDGSLLPLHSIGDDCLATTGISAPTVTVCGNGQATGALVDNGNMGGAVLAKDYLTTAGHGGAFLVGANAGNMTHFAGIKGSLVDGSGYSTGDLLVMVRRSAADPNLSVTGVFPTYGGYRFPLFTVAALPACNGTSDGTILGVVDALAPTYGATIVGGGLVRVPVFCDGNLGVWRAH